MAIKNEYLASVYKKTCEKNPGQSEFLQAVEEVLSMVEGYTIERVFPVDPRSEKLARKEGLHLWYRVKFAEDAPMEQMIAKLSRLGEVSTVNCNRRLRKNWSEKVIPFDPASRTTGLGSSLSAAPALGTAPSAAPTTSGLVYTRKVSDMKAS